VPSYIVSSAAGDDDPYVQDFFDDLAAAVGRLAEPVRGFLAISASDLRHWPNDLARAIGTCDAFIALYSRRFWLNPVCGRQWRIFDQRRGADGGPSPLIAVPWTADAVIPELLAGRATALATPSRSGLRQLVKLHSRREEYRIFLSELAEFIVGAARPGRVPRWDVVPALPEVANAFDTRDDPAPAGPPRIRFVVATGTRAEMAQVREAVAYYGATPADWSPYLPDLTEPLAHRAQAVAANHLCESRLGSLDEAVEYIERARRDGSLVVLLVDWWAVQLDSYQKLLAEIDRRGLGDTAILVPANLDDLETRRNREELRYGLRSVLRNRARGSTSLVRSEIETPDRFDAALARVIEGARNRLMRDPATAHPSPADRPILRGP
jgi:FxsC-like protein